MKASIVEMEGLLRGKCVPAKMLVKESLAEYLVRQFDSLHERAEAAEHERDELRAERDNWRASFDNERLRADKLWFEIERRDAAAGEPVGWQFLDVGGKWKPTEDANYHSKRGYKVRMVFAEQPPVAAAQPAVLPPEMLPENALEIETLHGVKLSQMQRAIAADAYNQCRADAMALGAQQQKVVELPEPVKWPEIPFKYFSEEQVFSMLDAAGVKWEVKK